MSDYNKNNQNGFEKTDESDDAVSAAGSADNGLSENQSSVFSQEDISAEPSKGQFESEKESLNETVQNGAENSGESEKPYSAFDSVYSEPAEFETGAFSQNNVNADEPSFGQPAEENSDLNENNCSYHYANQGPFNSAQENSGAADGFNNKTENDAQAQHYSYNQANAYQSQNGVPGYNGSSQQPYDFSANAYRQQRPQQPFNFQNGAGGQNGTVPPKKKSSSTGKIAAIAAAVLVVVVAVMVVVFSKVGVGSKNQSSTTMPTQVTNAQGEVSGANSLQYSTTDSSNLEALSAVQVAEKARDSVVGIMTYSEGQLSGEGSGVVMGVDSTGKYTYIITCAHVISGSGLTYGVGTLDGKKYEAEMVAYDTRTDVGVLKVEATDLKAAEFGDSSTLKVGETVYAIGNPGGSEYFGSMTNGIISAIDRSVSGTYTMTCIQHNAAINPGNSGGALVNSAGQVIGINSSKIAATDYEGMGFAVPMATVKTVVDALIEYGYVPNRPKLGIQYASVDNYQLYSMVVAIKGLPAGSLVIAKISEDSSLAKTQAQVGDLIIAVNGKKMDSSDVLLDLIDTGAVGDQITLTLCRVNNRNYSTSEFDVTITLVEDKGEKEETTTQPQLPENNSGSDLEDFFRKYFGQ